ncbi:hypothetical protein BaRGS_00018324 [Batillaria attramentaria]|uniref:Uncharacterized protein n=1 Tax=Batillaria attramentaria TaxID=370345 RepID=A0ABD0KU40_9CAEN
MRRLCGDRQEYPPTTMVVSVVFQGAVTTFLGVSMCGDFLTPTKHCCIILSLDRPNKPRVDVSQRLTYIPDASKTWLGCGTEQRERLRARQFV